MSVEFRVNHKDAARTLATQDRRIAEHERWANVLVGGNERGDQNLRRQGISYFKKLDEEDFTGWWDKAFVRLAKLGASEHISPKDSIAAFVALANIIEMKLKHSGESREGGRLNLHAGGDINITPDKPSELPEMVAEATVVVDG